MGLLGKMGLKLAKVDRFGGKMGLKQAKIDGFGDQINNYTHLNPVEPIEF